jgi:hypothetical protein
MQETGKPNHVTVTINADGNPVCDPHELSVTGSNVELKFVLDAKGYVFLAKDAIVVGEPGSQFPHASKTLPPNDTKATLFDHNTKTANFSYTVYVQEVASGKILRVDPVIANEG